MRGMRGCERIIQATYIAGMLGSIGFMLGKYLGWF
jgi:hypothetical protein